MEAALRCIFRTEPHKARAGGTANTGCTEYRTIFAVATTLFIMTFAMTLLAHFVVRRYRGVY